MNEKSILINETKVAKPEASPGVSSGKKIISDTEAGPILPRKIARVLCH